MCTNDRIMAKVNCFHNVDDDKREQLSYWSGQIFVFCMHGKKLELHSIQSFYHNPASTARAIGFNGSNFLLSLFRYVVLFVYDRKQKEQFDLGL